MTVSKLHPLAFGIALGIISGLSTLIMGLLAYLVLNGKPLVSMFGTMYITYNPSLINSTIGGLIVFINAIIAGVIVAWLYNLLLSVFLKNVYQSMEYSSKTLSTA